MLTVKPTATSPSMTCDSALHLSTFSHPIYQEFTNKSLPVIRRSHGPPTYPMSAPHRGLPPPAAMTLPPQQSPAAGAPSPAHHTPPPPPPPPSLAQSHQQRDSWAQLPAPPKQWQGAEEFMRNWLQAKAEEEKRRQEEEKTRQERLRLEQRKVEMDMLRTSLSGGIPPAMVPLVLAGMGSGGVLPHAALEWAQHLMPPSQVHHPQLLPPQPVSLEHQRDPQAHGQYHIPPAPGGPPPPAGYAYSGSPARSRGQTVAGTMGPPVGTNSNLPSLNTITPQPTHAGAPGMASHPHLQQAQSARQESQTSLSTYFHHWQPPKSQAGSSFNRRGTPSGLSKAKRKRDSL